MNILSKNYSARTYKGVYFDIMDLEALIKERGLRWFVKCFGDNYGKVTFKYYFNDTKGRDLQSIYTEYEYVLEDGVGKTAFISEIVDAYCLKHPCDAEAFYRVYTYYNFGTKGWFRRQNSGRIGTRLRYNKRLNRQISAVMHNEGEPIIRNAKEYYVNKYEFPSDYYNYGQKNWKSFRNKQYKYI